MSIDAEREGFEPSVPDKGYTSLAGKRLRPLSHLSIQDPHFNMTLNKEQAGG